MRNNELIASAAIATHVCGDCKCLYDEDVLKEYDMTAEQMETFLSENSEIIDTVESQLFEKIVELARGL